MDVLVLVNTTLECYESWEVPEITKSLPFPSSYMDQISPNLTRTRKCFTLFLVFLICLIDLKIIGCDYCQIPFLQKNLFLNLKIKSV